MSNVTREQLIHIKKVLFAATTIESQHGVIHLDDEDRQALFVSMEKHFKARSRAYYKNLRDKSPDPAQVDIDEITGDTSSVAGKRKK